MDQGRSDGGGYPPPPKKKSAQVNFVWGKNDVRMAIQQFYTPKTNFWLCPWNGHKCITNLGGHVSARKLCIKINKMPEFNMILAQKIIKIPEGL